MSESGSQTETDGRMLCRDCGHLKPKSDFRRRRRDGDRRERQCRPCHATAERERNQRRRSGEFKDGLRRLAKSRGERQIGAACNAMIEMFGGVVGMAKAFKNEYDNAPAGSQIRTDIMMVCLRMLRYRDGWD